MKHLYLVLFSCTFLAGSLTAQNLVTNPGFEDIANCSTGFLPPGSNISDAESWLSPNTASADHFNACHTTFSINLSTPNNFMGIQEAIDSSYAGLITFEDTSLTSNYREYIQVPLTEPLAAGVTYSIGYYCSLAEDAQFASGNLAMHLSENAPSQGDQYMIDLESHLESDIITETGSWVQVHGSYTAQGGESYVTLGNFHTDTETDLEDLGSGFFVRAYYYVDEVYVIDSTTTTGVLSAMNPSMIRVYPNPADDALHITISDPNQGLKVSIVNHLGAVVRTINIEGRHEAVLDISELQQGLYYVKAETTHSTDIHRFIKK
jgi:hypothetical protein